MSNYTSDDKFVQLLAYAEANCQPFVTTLAATYLNTLNWSSLLIVFALYVYGARQRELWATLLGFGLTLDWIFNAALRALIRQPRPLPTCGAGFGMPAFESEHASFFVVSLIAFAMQWESPHTKTVYLVLLVAYVAAVNAMLVYFNYATPAQALVGDVIGAVLGALWQLFVFGTVRWHFDAIIEKSTRFYPVVDTTCISCEPVRGDPPPLVRIVDEE